MNMTQRVMKGKTSMVGIKSGGPSGALILAIRVD